jgi:GalNAc-alpha-(1->4)-GalNAc-alpha-(1->3)-diNAcBac-PP-undecaprenol alpha-1,4-N-acetyl-D-galactosaminyltransferase
MKIALVISSLNAGGAEHVLSDLANYWVSKGNTITIITLSSPETKPFYQLDPRITLIQLNKLQEESSFLKRIQGIFKRILCLRKTVRALNPDIVVSFVDVMNIMTLMSTRGLKLPVIISERIDPSFHILPKLYTWLRLKFYPFSKRLIVQTESAAGYFPPTFKHFITIIPNPVKKQKNIKKQWSGEVKKIVTIGRLDPQKDHTTLIYALARISKDYPDITLTIYGEGGERNRLEQLINSLSLQEKVFLPGITRHVHEVLCDADLFVFPSRYEGFPNALCEAMAVGLPVIASDCSGNRDIIRDSFNGRLFPVGDVDVLTEIIRDLLNDGEKRQHLAKNALDMCERFHPSKIFEMWDRVINEGNI